MTEPLPTLQELYDRLRQTSREEVILLEMVRLGFWPAGQPLPRDPAEEIQRRQELQAELAALRAGSRRLQDEQALLKKMRRDRLAAARQKRQETKARREQERQARAEAWRQKKTQEILYLGAGLSAGLNQTGCDPERLAAGGLPAYGTAAEIATAMGISVGELRFLAFARQTSTVSHYVRFKIPKKTGGERLISAPMPRLKAVQHWLLEHILAKVDLADPAHGFRPGRSIVSNARPHQGADLVVNIDLQDFFPSISYKRVKGLFRSLGYSEAAATIFGLLCTEPDVTEVELDGRTYFVAASGRHLPQGAPTSPAITNILCRRLDRRLAGLAAQLGFTYTRYADDLTLSASGEAAEAVGPLLKRVEAIIRAEGFTLNPRKTRVLRRSRQQEVTGLVVNHQVNISKKILKRFRATLYQIEKDGPAGKRWGPSLNVLASIEGFANFVYMVNPAKGAELRARVRATIARYSSR